MSVDPELQLSSAEMRRLGYRVIDQLVEHFEQLPQKPTTQLTLRAELEPRLSEPLPEAPSDLEELLALLQCEVWSNIGHTNHPRFFAFIPAPSNFISVLAAALTAGFNPFAGNWFEASGPTQIELVTIDWLRQLCGLPETAGGHFVPSGSLANLTALAVARHTKLADNVENAVIYYSDQTHSCVERALRLLGFKPEQLRSLPSNAQFRLPMAALRAAVSFDRAKGRQPFCVVANAGTTNTGAIDPLPELVELCRAENLWLHVDGAYGAAAALCERGKQLLAGLEQVDSLALDPHKWLFQPYETGVVLVREARLLRETFFILPAYLKDTVRENAAEINFADEGIQLTREFRALKLWLSLKTFGLAAFRAAVERGFELIALAERVLRESSSWEVIASPVLSVVVFRFAPAGLSEERLNALNQQLVQAAFDDGFAFVNSTTLRGQTVLRMCTINPRTTEADIRASLARLEKLGNELAERNAE
jgi:aromatic-L-amino-acid/L-tryptophan decarboxylase